MKTKINIVIPMAGLGSRFSAKGYIKPKPFIDVLGRPMIEHVLENLFLPEATYYLIIRKEHYESEKEVVNYLKNKFKIEYVVIDHFTEGSACTVLLAKEFIDSEVPLVIANSDQIVDIDFAQFISKAIHWDGYILSFIDNEKNEKWSFVKLDSTGKALEVKEKNAISDIATVGIYYFNKGHNFIESANAMIRSNERVNNEFYTCPVYNYFINSGAKVGVHLIDEAKMHGTGTPEDLDLYINYITNKR